MDSDRSIDVSRFGPYGAVLLVVVIAACVGGFLLMALPRASEETPAAAVTPTAFSTSTPTAPTATPSQPATVGAQGVIRAVRMVDELPDRIIVDVDYTYQGSPGWLLANLVIDGQSRGTSHTEELVSAPMDVIHTSRVLLACDLKYLPGAFVHFAISLRVASGPYIRWPGDITKQCP